LELKSLLSTPAAQRGVLERLQNFLIRKNLTPAMLHELLDLTSYENARWYLPEVTFLGSSPQEDFRDSFITIEEMVKPGTNENSLKYPLGVAEFERFVVGNQTGKGRGGKEYELLYSKLDCFGSGFVNLNEVSELRGKYPDYVSPYVHIPSYL
jgi:hypothetical protein